MIKLIGMGGIREYLLAVLAYYDKEFLHALEHLDKAKDLLGTVSLSGNSCYQFLVLVFISRITASAD